MLTLSFFLFLKHCYLSVSKIAAYRYRHISHSSVSHTPSVTEANVTSYSHTAKQKQTQRKRIQQNWKCNQQIWITKKGELWLMAKTPQLKINDHVRVRLLVRRRSCSSVVWQRGQAGDSWFLICRATEKWKSRHSLTHTHTYELWRCFSIRVVTDSS